MAGKILHLKERNGRYSARLIVPPPLRPFLPPPDTGKVELEIQLGGDLRIAKRNHAAAVADIQRRIGIARQRHEAATGKQAKAAPYPLTVQQIAVRDYQNQIDFDAEIRAHDHRYAQFDLDPDEARRYRDGFAGKLSDDELEELVGWRAERARLAGNTDAIKGKPEWRALAQALCVASYEAMHREAERNDGDYTGKPTHPLLANTPPLVEDEPEPITFNDIIDDEVKRRARGKDAKPLPAKTVKKFRDNCAAFAKYRKSDNVLTVTAAEGKAWIEAMQDAEEIGNRTIKDKFQNVTSVINWGRSNDPANVFPTGNPLSGVKTPDYKTTPSHLLSFTLDEARLVLSAARKETRPLFRWSAWLCAYSGMRISEANKLRKEDFFQIDGRWFWRVTTAGGRALKNEGSERRIPVHKTLLDEGFIAFVEAAPAGRLFKGELKDEIDITQQVCRWVRDLIPIKDRPDLRPNHGWRHMFEDLCRQGRVQEAAARYMSGRRDGKSHEIYGGSDIMLPGLAAEMDRIKPIKLDTK